MRTELEALSARVPAIERVRGRGLLQGLVLDRPAKPVVSAVLDAGVITGRAGERVLRFAPPLILSDSDIAQAVAAVEAALAGDSARG